MPLYSGLFIGQEAAGLQIRGEGRKGEQGSREMMIVEYRRKHRGREIMEAYRTQKPRAPSSMEGPPVGP